MARNGHIYSYDDNQNVIFPAQVVATKNFKGYLNGTASNADNASKVNNHTVLSVCLLMLSLQIQYILSQ